MKDRRKLQLFSLIIMASFFLASIIGDVVLFTNKSYAQGDLIIYPKEGQDNEQLEKDKYACYQWSKKESGFDPMEMPKATAPPPPKKSKRRGALRGAARGAAFGAVVGEIADDDAGKGAAIGASTGALMGGMRSRNQVAQEKQAEQEWVQHQAAQYDQKRSTYNRAYSACLEARGYTVK